MILSIIVPSYNVSKFVPEYESLFYSPALEGRVEFLFVDDGATDGTFELLHGLEKRHPEYFRAFHKENGGHGSVINYGLERCRGKYFKVIDGDDSIDKNELSRFIDFLTVCDADLVVSDFERVFVNDGCRSERVYCFADGNAPESDLIQGCPFLQLHSMTYSVSLWKENGIRVREKAFYEDQEYCIFPLPFVRRVEYFRGVTYRYSIGVEGQSISISGLRKHFSDHVLCMQDLLQNYENTKDKDFPYRQLWLTYIAFAVRNHFEAIMFASEKKNLRPSINDFKKEASRYAEIWERAKQWSLVRSLTFSRGTFAWLVRTMKMRKNL